MTELTEVQELERKILLQQQAIQNFKERSHPECVETCREIIRTYRRMIWILEGK